LAGGPTDRLEDSVKGIDDLASVLEEM